VTAANGKARALLLPAWQGICFWLGFWRYSRNATVFDRGLMEERRKHPRTEINEPALVSAGGSVMSCVVCNISAEGAAIEVENPAFVPARFRLVMTGGATVHECSVAWIRDKRIGLVFIAAPQSGE